MKSLYILFLGCLCLVQASHFRFGTMTWKIPDRTKPLNVEFELSCIFRYSYFNMTLVKGQQLNFAVSDPKNEMQWGDGTSQTGVYGIVQSVNLQQDSVSAIFTKNHTYTAAGTYVAYFSSHARLSTLENNANLNYVVSTQVTVVSAQANLVNANSPISGSLPIIPATQNIVNTIPLSGNDQEDHTNLIWALSTPAQQGDASSTQPPKYSIDSSTGVITWDTTGLALGLYNSQIRITDQNGAFICLDFLLNLTAQSAVPPPVFQDPTPAQGSDLTAPVGNPIVITICASDASINVLVTLSQGSLPAGANFNPPAAANPICCNVTWTPTPDQAGEDFTFPFEATTQTGSSATRTFTVSVPALPTGAPTAGPSMAPTMMPTDMPTDAPTMPPTMMPTDMPTGAPTMAPTMMPTGAPTMPPTMMPTGAPTMAPTMMPTGTPTKAPTQGPAPFCGDDICQSSERCDSCPADCNGCPQVIYHRATGEVVTATSFGSGATINLTSYDGVSRPSIYQAWNYNSATGYITLCYNGFILGAGPTAHKQPTSEHHIAWDFKAALQNETGSAAKVDTFSLIPVAGTSNPTWNYIEDQLFNGNGNMAQASCLMAPYAKSPANVANQEVWGPNCQTTTNFQWRFQTFMCDFGVKCGC